MQILTGVLSQLSHEEKDYLVENDVIHNGMYGIDNKLYVACYM